METNSKTITLEDVKSSNSPKELYEVYREEKLKEEIQNWKYRYTAINEVYKNCNAKLQALCSLLKDEVSYSSSDSKHENIYIGSSYISTRDPAYKLIKEIFAEQLAEKKEDNN